MRVTGAWFRHHAHDVSADRPTTRGWRWNPEGTPTLYLASTPESCRREFFRLIERAGFREDEVLPRALTRFRVLLQDAVSLRTTDELRRYRLKPADLGDRDMASCRRVAKRIVAEGAEGIVTLSTVGQGETLVAFPGNLRSGSRIRPTGTRQMQAMLLPWKWTRY